jgi:hypothetical protein
MPKKFLFGAVAILMAMTFAGCGDPSHGEGGPGPEPGKESAKGGAVITNMC